MKKLSIVLALVACLFAGTGTAQTTAPVGPMATYEVEAPNGKKYRVEAPDGTTHEQLVHILLGNHPEANIAKPATQNMYTYTVEAPNGKTYDVRAPKGADATFLSKELYKQHPEAAIPKPPISGTDLSKVSTADLEAFISGKGSLAGVSEAGRRILAVQDATSQPSQSATTPTTINTNTTDVTSTLRTNTSFNESIAIGLVFGGLLWLAGGWQWKKLIRGPKHAGKAKLESAKNLLFVTLGVDIVATSGVVASYAWAVATLKDMSSGLITADQSLISRLSALDSLFLVLLLTTAGVGVGLVKWLNACYLYAKEVIGATGFKNEKWTTGSWIIPIFNLFKPYQIINEIYKAGAPGYAHPDGWKKESGSGQLLAWWVLWAFIHFVWWSFSLMLKKSKATDLSIGTIEFQAWILVSSVVVALLWFAVAGRLTRRLMDRSSSVTVAPIAPSHQAANVEQIASPMAARESTQSTPKPQLTSSEEEAIYEQALAELSANKKPGLWAMALAQTATGGNPDGAYIALRVEQLRELKRSQ